MAAVQHEDSEVNELEQQLLIDENEEICYKEKIVYSSREVQLNNLCFFLIFIESTQN